MFSSTPAHSKQIGGGSRIFRNIALGCGGAFVLFILLIVLIALLAPTSEQGSGSSADEGQAQQEEAAPEREEQASNESDGGGLFGDLAEDAEPEPVEEPEPITLSGSGPTASEPFQLESGLTIVRMTHQGDANFIVDVLNDQGDPLGMMGIVNTIGPFQGSTPVQVPEAGEHILDVDANGPWEITVEQPRVTEAPATTSFSGDSQQATELFQLSGGLHTFRMTHQGGGNFIVDLLDDEGYGVTMMGLANEIGPYDGSTAERVPEDGVYLLAVQADGPWTIEIE